MWDEQCAQANGYASYQDQMAEEEAAQKKREAAAAKAERQKQQTHNAVVADLQKRFPERTKAQIEGALHRNSWNVESAAQQLHPSL